MEKCLKPVTIQSHKKILDQMNNYIYEIKEKEKRIGYCFFCYIKYKAENIPVIVVEYQIIEETYLAKNNSISVSINGENKVIIFGKVKYMDKKHKLSIIEIEDKKDGNINFLELDDLLYLENSEIFYHEESIYLIYYNINNNISVSYGITKDIRDSNIVYFSYINSNVYGFPIFSLSNNKLIGIYKNKSQNNKNKGIFFKYIINEFIKEKNYVKKQIKNINNEIKITFDIEKNDINSDKKIYFLNNYENESNKMQSNSEENYNDLKELIELNELNTKLYIKYNNVVSNLSFQKYFKPEKEGIYHITIKFNNNLTDCSYMFACCKDIIELNFISFNTEYVTDMKYMFYKCEKLKNINLFSFDTKNVTNMSYMFYGCQLLKNIDLSSFDTKNVIDMSYMFYACNNLNSLDLSLLDTKNVENMSYIYYGCDKINDFGWPFLDENEIIIKIQVKNSDINKEIFFLDNYDKHDNLKELNKLNTELYINNIKIEYNKSFVPKAIGIFDVLIKFNNIITDCSFMFARCKNIISIKFIHFITKYVTNMKNMFDGCDNLKTVNLSSFKTQNVTDMSYLFSNCDKLNKIDLSSFVTKKVINMCNMFDGCKNLTYLDLSSFSTKNVIDMSYMFSDCKNLNKINISSFKTENVSEMRYMFCGCNKLKYLNLSSFNTNNVSNMSYMFNECNTLKSLDLSSFNTKNVTDMSYMFNGCNNLISLNLSSFDTKNVKDMSYMFAWCKQLNGLNLSNFDIENVDNYESIFYNSQMILYKNISKFKKFDLDIMVNSNWD